MDWWTELESSVQITLVTSMVNIVVVAIGFFFTYRASIKAAKLSSDSSLEQAESQISAHHKEKLAEFRLSWIEALRNSAATLYRDQYELSLLKRDIAKLSPSRLAERKKIRSSMRDLYLRIAQTKNDIILRINPKTDDEDEILLLSLLRKTVGSDRAKSLQLRREISRTINNVLRKEWKKASQGLTKLGMQNDAS